VQVTTLRLSSSTNSSLLPQIPVLVFSFILVATKVSIKLPSDVENESTYAKLRRIDALGSFTLVGTVGTLLLGFSLKTTEEMPWGHPFIVGLFAASAVFGVLFVLVETHWSPYPVMPLRLITQRTPLAVSLCNLLGSMAAFSMVRFCTLPPFRSNTRSFFSSIMYLW
jgi:hypothetical protein